MGKFKTFISGAVLSLFFGVSPVSAELFGLSSFVLDNGMQVLVIPNHKAPIIKHMVWYKAGSVDEPRGKGGTAHLLEHLMFRGTRKVKDGVFNDLISRNGGESNAFTSLDYTAYHQELDISRLELAIFLEADRMQNLKITPEAFAKERDIVFQERKQVVDNNPLSYFGESMRKLLWQDHPYALSVGGTPEDIMAITQEDVERFYEQFYAPNNAILVLSGDIDVKTAKELAEKYYGKVKSRPVGKKVDFPKLSRRFKADMQMRLEAANAPRLVRTYLAPSFNTDAGQIYALSVFSKYLGEGENSKLYKNLVLKQKKALAVSSSYDYADRSYGTFTIAAVPAKGVSREELEKALDDAVAEAVSGINAAEVDKTKHKMLAGLVYLKDNPNDAAYIAGMLAAVGFSAEEIDNGDIHLRDVGYRDVKKAADAILQAPTVSGWLLPLKEDD